MHDPDYKRPWMPWREVLSNTRFYVDIITVQVGIGRRAKQVIEVAWKPPPCGWIKLNTDVAASLETGRAGCGGLFSGPDSN